LLPKKQPLGCRTGSKEAIAQEPTMIYPHLSLAGIYTIMGMEKEAREEIAEVYKLDPQFSLSSIPFPHKDPEVAKKYFSMLRKAGFH